MLRYQPTEADIERQIRWELHAVERGAERVRKQIEDQTIADSPMGRRLLAKLARKVVVNIRKAQMEAVDIIAEQRKGRPQTWWWLIQTLTAEQLTVLTFRSIFNTKPREAMTSLPLTSTALRISSACHQQLDFEVWQAEQKEVEKATGDSQFKEYLRTNSTINAKSFQRFSSKVQRLRLGKWSREKTVA